MKTGLTRTTLLTCILGVTLLVSSCESDELGSIQYPDAGFYGVNILSPEKTTYTVMKSSLQAKIPKGQTLKVVVTGLTAAFPTGVWYYTGATSNNWAVSGFDISTNKQSFTSIDGGLTCDVEIQFDEGTFQIDYYQNGSVTPTSTKTIEVQ